MYELGWSVFRAEFGRYVPPDRVLRAVVVGAAVTAIVAVALVVVGLLAPWPDLREPLAWVGLLLLAVGAGTFAVAVVPLRPRPAGADRLSWSGAYMQAPERTERYFRMRTAPTLDPRDRDEVLRDAEVVRAGLVPDVFRGFLVAAALVLVAVGLLLVDAHLPIIGFVSVFLVGRLVTSLVRLGRVERVRALAEALPPIPASDGRPPQARRGGERPDRDRPTGSKLSLPGE
ncbi:hypothetical protein [Curtobacterium sp. L1-20]|uniref:hypothetical protein n=1 Tax=Curtobacterium sp. L1-20 TaxID=3138181 RepID=UPI003B520F6C